MFNTTMFKLLLLSGMALTLNACAYHRLVVKQPNAGDQNYHKVHSSALAWGLIEDPKTAGKCETNLLSEVRAKTSLVQSLATVFTLGFWQPATIEYRCSKLPTGEGEIKP